MTRAAGEQPDALDLTLADLDVDEALRETAAAAFPPRALFSHRTHQSFGCYACHPSVFPQALVGFTHDDMREGKFCGRCHDGRGAFAIAGADSITGPNTFPVRLARQVKS